MRWWVVLTACAGALLLDAAAGRSAGYLKTGLAAPFKLSSASVSTVGNFTNNISVITDGVTSQGSNATCLGVVGSSTSQQYQVTVDLGAAYLIRDFKVAVPSPDPVASFSSSYWDANVTVRVATVAVSSAVDVRSIGGVVKNSLCNAALSPSALARAVSMVPAQAVLYRRLQCRWYCVRFVTVDGRLCVVGAAEHVDIWRACHDFAINHNCVCPRLQHDVWDVWAVHPVWLHRETVSLFFILKTALMWGADGSVP